MKANDLVWLKEWRRGDQVLRFCRAVVRAVRLCELRADGWMVEDHSAVVWLVRPENLFAEVATAGPDGRPAWQAMRGPEDDEFCGGVVLGVEVMAGGKFRLMAERSGRDGDDY